MTHFGIISPPVSGHIHPMSALGRELVARGHRVTFFQLPDLEQKIASEGLEFRPYGGREFPVGSLQRWLAELGRRKGLTALRFTIDAVARTSAALLRDGPNEIRAAGIDALLVDQMEPAGGALAEHLALPFVTVCNALAINRDPVAPPPFTPWRFRDTWWARARNVAGYAASDWMTRPISRVVAGQREAWKLPELSSPDESFSKLAQICQMPKAFDYPRRAIPEGFHYVGPLRRDPPKPIPFPWDRLDGRPLVYASLGTLQNSREALFRTFAEACQGLDVQLVISHGGGLTAEQVQKLPGDSLVFDYVPQTELLKRATLTLTHAGLNTVLDSLAAGVPLVAVPITYEQPAIAGRVERSGCGRAISLAECRPPELRAAIDAVRGDSGYATAAMRLAAEMATAGGVGRAADVVERVTRAASHPAGGQADESLPEGNLPDRHHEPVNVT